jgi:nucleoside-diphosphate-sugar epimerase
MGAPDHDAGGGMSEALKGRTALVTGGTGFIGGRLIEILIGQFGMKVRTLVRGTSTGSGAYRAAAAGAEFVTGSLTDAAAMHTALEGVDYVFHCAFGSHGDLAEQRRVTVEGTRTLAAAAGVAGVKHFVNLGTIVSFGADTPAEVDESYVARRMWKWPYAIDKRDAELAIAEEHRRSGLAATTLRLGVIYGPYGPAFTLYPLALLKTSRLALIDGGRGVCAAAYVDDVIQAILLAAQRPVGAAETFIIRGPDRVTWRQFYESYEAMLGVERLVEMSRADMRGARGKLMLAAMRAVVGEGLAALKASPDFKRAAGALPLVRPAYAMIGKRRAGTAGDALPAKPAAATTPELPVELIPPMMVDYYASTTEYRIDRARTELGYAPVFDLAAGMALTAQWARWANLIPPAV